MKLKSNKKNNSYISINIFIFLAVILIPLFNTYGQTVPCIKISKNLKIKDVGNEVVGLQNFLINKGLLNTQATGYFGYLTERAVINFQKSSNLPNTGLVGTMTRNKIQNETCVLSNDNSNQGLPITLPPQSTPIASQSLQLPYNSSNFSNWTSMWGNVSTTSDSQMEMRATENTNGAEAILLNTQDWKDYKLNANIFVKQATVTLLVRYVDENNFLGCTFSGRYIEIIQKVNGVIEVVAYTSLSDYANPQFFYNDKNVYARVKGNTIGCAVLGADDNVSYSKINPDLTRGGVGIQTYVSTPNIANIIVKNINITNEN